MGGFGILRDNLLVLPSEGTEDKGRGEGTVLSSMLVVAVCIIG